MWSHGPSIILVPSVLTLNLDRNCILHAAAARPAGFHQGANTTVRH